MNPRLSGRLVVPAELASNERGQLFAIYSRHYEGASLKRFESDLNDKDYVILLSSTSSGQLQGFSTQKVLSFDFGDARRRAIFSGDTVIDRSFWGEQELVKSWCRFAGQVAAQQPDQPLYWFLITKGYRTYLYLPVFFKDYYPRYDAATPDFERQLMDYLAGSKYPDHYNPATGIITFRGTLDRLIPELSLTPISRLDDPRVEFYLERNPGCNDGDELVSLTEITPANMKSLARRMFLEGLRLGPPPIGTVHA